MEKRFIKGLFKDTGRLDQPEGTWRYAKNAVLNSTKGAISNEKGNSNVESIPASHIILGSVSVSDGGIVLFTILPSNNISTISLFKNNVFTTLFQTSAQAFNDYKDLNFKETNPIEGTFKIDSKGDLIVYWVDDLNPPRAFNVSRQERSLLQSGITKLYGIQNPANPKTHIDLLNLFPSSGKIPTFIYHSILSGGALLSGVYYLALAYVDEDLVATNYLTVSNPVSIIEESIFTRPTTNIDGLKEGSQTSKSITWNIKNVNTDYKFLRAAIVRKKGDAVEVFKLNDLSVSNQTTMSVSFTGTESVSPGSVEEIMIDTVGYESAKTINQLDNVLYIGNLKSSKDVGFQKYANAIRLESTLQEISPFDTFFATQDNFETGFSNTAVDLGQTVDGTKSYRYDTVNSKFRGYLRDETYAFYIAFVLNDGSMSYAYHIPGREAMYNDEISNISSTGGTFNEENLELKSAKRFHLKDYSDPNSLPTIEQATPLSDPSQQMNYWENQSEFYPDTEDYNVFKITGEMTATGSLNSPAVATQIDGSAITLNNKNVRHHHFPSNDNYFRKSISNGHSVTSYQAALPTQEFANVINYTGTYKFERNTTNSSDYYAITEDTASSSIKYTGDSMIDALTSGWSPPLRWQDVDLSSMSNANITANNIFAAVSSVDSVSTAGIYDGETGIFTANQSMLIENMSFKSWYKRGAGDGQFKTFKTRIVIEKGGERYYTVADHDVSSDDWGVSGYNSTFGFDKYDYNTKSGINDMYPESNAGGDTSGVSEPIQLTTGDKMWMECRAFIGSNPDFSIRQMNTDEFNGNDNSYWQFDIDTTPTTDFTTAGYDAKISQTVSALGFHLHDIKVPKSIADKAQGFRIYRAKRDHKNKSILGQSLVLPMTKATAAIGMCQESLQEGGATNIMQALSDENQVFYKTSPWPALQGSYGSTGYTHFTFHDFNLLRSKSSLAGATHIKPIYMVNNLVWNGPTLRQDKKMVTKIVNYDPNTPNTLKEIWGHDATFNCYTEEIESAIFIGLEYVFNVQTSSYAQDVEAHRFPRMLAQKAKTYLLGDTIFEGESLGFGGKVFNEYGESCIALALKNNQGLPAQKCTPDGSAADNSDYFGFAHPDAPAWLVNADLITASSTAGSDAAVQAASRYYNYMVNLHAHKTDLYKSLDSQELVYTGYEVLGDDFQNFIFDDDTTSDTYLQHVHAGNLTAHNLTALTLYSTTLNADYNENTKAWSNGIFGGDTFICRYGFASTLTPSDSLTKSTPQKAIYYNIVESNDNINFRHSEDGDSLYFPNTPAKTLLKKAGTKDFSHFDNIKYNSNYSEDTDIRTAVPFPVREIKQLNFPTRTHRSVIADNTSLIDNYRILLSNQYKDLPKNRGSLWKLSSFNNLLYFHMENSLFATKGKQTMEMKDGTEAFIGSGDIFVQPPDEVLQTELGYGGTQSQRAAITTRYGYFFVNKISKKVFLMSDKLNNIGELGLDEWFLKNLDFHLEAYELPATTDNPVIGIGLHSIWDEIEKRILLTKNDLNPTQKFIDGYNKYKANGIDSPGAIWYNEETGYYNKSAITISQEIVESITSTGTEPPVNWEAFLILINQSGVSSGFFQSHGDYVNNGSCDTPGCIPLVQNAFGYFGYYIHPGSIFSRHFFNSDLDSTLSDPTFTEDTLYSYDDDAVQPLFIQNDNGWQAVNWPNLPIATWEGLTPYEYYLYANPSTSDEIIQTSTWTYTPLDYLNSEFFIKGGWTVSFYPEINAWGGFHSYLPYTYFSKFNALYSITSGFSALLPELLDSTSQGSFYALQSLNSVIWQHQIGEYGEYYPTSSTFLASDDMWTSGEIPQLLATQSFEIEFIDNTRKAVDSVFSSLSYTVDVINSDQVNVLQSGFSDFFVYNTKQISGLTELEYLINTRQAGNNWKINSFRDFAALEKNTDEYYMSPSLNVVGEVNTGTVTVNSTQAMFSVDGMSEIINNLYINKDKAWNLQRKFVDKWLGIRLICDNIQNNSVNLYTAEVSARKYHR